MKRHLCLSIFIGSLLTLSAHATSAAPLAVSTFNTDTEGWTIFGDATGPVFEAAAGNPPGDIIATDLITVRIFACQRASSCPGLCRGGLEIPGCCCPHRPRHLDKSRPKLLHLNVRVGQPGG